MSFIDKEAIEVLEAGISVYVSKGKYEYEVSPSDNWIGGEGSDGYISEALGNVVYSDAEGVLEETVRFLEKDGAGVKIRF